MKWREMGESPCPIARSLAIVGDRWTILILRNAFLRTRRFDDFQAQLGITRHLLASRLAKLVKLGVLAKVPYQERPLRHEYRLTDMGRDWYSVQLSLVAWGNKWMGGDTAPRVEYLHQTCGHRFRPTVVCSECREPIDARAVTPIAAPGAKIRREATGG